MGRAWVTGHALATKKDGKVDAGIPIPNAEGRTLYPPRLMGRALRCRMAKDNVKCPLQGALEAKGTNRAKAQKVLVLAQSSEMVTALLRVHS